MTTRLIPEPSEPKIWGIRHMTDDSSFWVRREGNLPFARWHFVCGQVQLQRHKRPNGQEFFHTACLRLVIDDKKSLLSDVFPGENICEDCLKIYERRSRDASF